VRRLLARVARWWWRDRNEAALAEELEHHRSLVQADLETRGLPPAEALAESRRAMGNTTLAMEDARDVWVAPWLAGLWRDVRHGLRGLRREATFSLAAILTLALGVATTTAVFSVADAELWKPLPYPDPDQLVVVVSRGSGESTRADGISGADLLDWRAEAPAFAELAAEGRTSRQVLHLDTAESVRVTEVTANYFETLGRVAVAGRRFTGDDARGTSAAVVTDRTWRSLFAADPDVIGRTVTLDGHDIVIVGVVRADDSLGPDPDLFVALDERAPDFLDRSQVAVYGAIGRLKPEASAAVARAQLQAVATRLAREHHEDRIDHRIELEDLRRFFTGYNWRPFYFFLIASLVVLLLSAVNVATLVLGRAFRRTHEFALRRALGGGQAALARQLLVEGTLLALAGGAVGVLLTTWAVAVLTSAVPEDLLTRGRSIPVDLRVWAFGFGITALTTVLFAVTPLVAVRRVGLAGALGPRGHAGQTRAEGRARTVLLVGQVALTVILLSAAGIFLKSFVKLTHVPLGFDPANALALRLSLSGPAYAGDAQVRSYADALVGRARAVPGVIQAAIGSSSPLGSGPVVELGTAGQGEPADGAATRAIVRAVSPEYFRTLGIPVLRGRAFSAADGLGAPRVAIVNESAASRMFGGEDPLGRVVELLPARTPWTDRPGALTIVGVASNVKDVGLNEAEFGNIYVPFAQMPAPWMELVVRAGMPPDRVGAALAQAAAAVDATLPVISLSTYDERVAGVLQGDRFTLLLVGWFAGVAVLLAGVGVYGTFAYAVEARKREFGVCLVLGARPARLVGAALWQAGRLGLAGGALGLASTVVVARAIGSALYLVRGEHNGLLYGVTTTDPAMLACAFVGIVIVTLAAGAIPARRVARVDPASALRDE